MGKTASPQESWYRREAPAYMWSRSLSIRENTKFFCREEGLFVSKGLEHPTADRSFI